MAFRTLHRFSFSGQEVIICMKRLSVFSVGDLVRQKSILSSKAGGYGIIVAVMPSNIKCLWNDAEIRWLQSRQLYLIAKGQRGYQS